MWVFHRESLPSRIRSLRWFCRVFPEHSDKGRKDSDDNEDNGTQDRQYSEKHFSLSEGRLGSEKITKLVERYMTGGRILVVCVNVDESHSVPVGFVMKWWLNSGCVKWNFEDKYNYITVFIISAFNYYSRIIIHCLRPPASGLWDHCHKPPGPSK